MELEVLVQLCSPGVLDTVTGPEDLLCPGRPREHHRLVQLSLLRILHGAVRGQRPQLDVVDEGDVVRGMPVLPSKYQLERDFLVWKMISHQAVAVHVEGDGVYQVVDGLHHLLAALPGGAVDDGQTAAEVINF